MKQIIKHVKQYEKHLHAASSTENASRHGLARRTKIFRVGQKIFNAIAEKFYPRIKIFGRTIFSLTGPRVQRTRHFDKALILNYVYILSYFHNKPCTLQKGDHVANGQVF